MRPPDVEPSSVERESLRVFAQTKALVDRYPDDAGVLVTLLLNHVVLAAGEAMFIAAGVIHAYTSGFGVEIMAASDNVLRAGLTPKHVDIPELLEITNFTPIPPPLWAGTPVTDADGVKLAPPVEEFELVVASIDGEEPMTDDVRPMIVLCLDGELRVSTQESDEKLHPGEAVFVGDSDGRTQLSGTARFALARTPDTQVSNSATSSSRTSLVEERRSLRSRVSKPRDSTRAGPPRARGTTRPSTRAPHAARSSRSTPRPPAC